MQTFGIQTLGTQTLGNFINGTFAKPITDSYIDSLCPATGEVIARVPDSDARDIDAAVKAARAAFSGWAATPAHERSTFLNRIADRLEANQAAFAAAESRDQGKPQSLAARMDIPRAIANFRFFAGAILHHEERSTTVDTQVLNYTLRTPVGVAGLITPWNLPLYLLTWKIAPALAVGNTVVCKPSEFTSLTAHMLCEIMQEVGLPQGVCNMVFGQGAKAGAALSGHPDVGLVSFTGGTQTGEAIVRATAGQFKKVSLELGGKNPNIIFADANLDECVPQTVRSSFLNQGEICLCGSRILVHSSVANAFVERFVTATSQLKVGDPTAPDTDVGALVSAAHLAKVESYVALARAEGGRILAGGKPPELAKPFDQGYFMQPTIIAGLPQSSRVVQEEIFGPVVTLQTFDTEEEAIALANGTKYGLAASVWTQDISRAHRVAARLEAGTTWVNCWLVRDLRVPFGGMKASGVGREGGENSLDFYTERKTVCVKL